MSHLSTDCCSASLNLSTDCCSASPLSFALSPKSYVVVLYRPILFTSKLNSIKYYLHDSTRITHISNYTEFKGIRCSLDNRVITNREKFDYITLKEADLYDKSKFYYWRVRLVSIRYYLAQIR